MDGLQHPHGSVPGLCLDTRGQTSTTKCGSAVRGWESMQRAAHMASEETQKLESDVKLSWPALGQLTKQDAAKRGETWERCRAALRIHASSHRRHHRQAQMHQAPQRRCKEAGGVQ